MWLHVLVWVYLFVSPFVDRRLMHLNLTVLLPLVFVMQSLPVHPLNGAKMVVLDRHMTTPRSAGGGSGRPQHRPRRLRLVKCAHWASTTWIASVH